MGSKDTTCIGFVYCMRVTTWFLHLCSGCCIMGSKDTTCIGFVYCMRNMNIGFVGDSLNENFLVLFLCIMRVADAGAKKWKRMEDWR
ncbi:hypothetical protein DVH24_037959 [Malus domestica]|uniref:Uncharacterized protein n=1 Tax=Malus domestica TaxID=3750 RepID=A0A498JYK4_MALDO|nr:hypothetical protein DVH24_037959 [Malus domestica]